MNEKESKKQPKLGLRKRSDYLRWMKEIDAAEDTEAGVIDNTETDAESEDGETDTPQDHAERE